MLVGLTYEEYDDNCYDNILFFLNKGLCALININDQCVERRKVCGEIRGVGTDKLIQANGSHPIGGVEIKPKYNALTGVNNSIMKSESGIIARNYAPLDAEKWVDISESNKVFMMEKLQV